MQNDQQTPRIDADEPAVSKLPWQTPDFEEMEVADSESAPPVTGGGDGPFLYS
jgi:hypothetical protein